jgi:outer membrane protein assembly factor BamB
VRIEPVTPEPQQPAETRRNRELLAHVPAVPGYALCYGGEETALLEALLAGSSLQLVVVEPDPERVRALRTRFTATGAYGKRVTVHQGDGGSFLAPPYFARLVLVTPKMASRWRDRRAWEAVYASVRPYGGVLWVAEPPDSRPDLARALRTAGLARARWVTADTGFGVVREGRLPGTDDWTHLYGNIANTVKSDDQTVKLPLGVLWFGGNSNLDVLPRHGHGPGEQVVGGRLFIQGMKSFSARDVYTGQRLWKTEIPDLDTFGVYYDETYTNAPLSTIYNQRHIPGANARGANFVATEEAVYLAVRDECRVLSAETGAVQRRIPMPAGPDGKGKAAWGFIGVYKDLLLGGRDFARYTQRYVLAHKVAHPPLVDLSASAGLAVFDRHTGKLLWQAPAHYGFLHNGIVAGNGRIYCLDRLPESIENKLKRRGRSLPRGYRVVAFDARTGALLWEHTNHVFGTWLAYSAEHDVLLQAGAQAPDRLADEAGQGMGVHQGRDGRLLWFKPHLKYTGPCILHHELIITTPSSYQISSGAYELLTGEPHWVTDPLTGGRQPWRIYRTYGCNTPVASEYLMTFRSGAAGFYDLAGQSGTGNWGGFKSGCTANLIIANGVLNAPDYTRTCTCAYQNQTSLGLVHMPDTEVWTYNVFDPATEGGKRVKRLGLNLGAPGDRRAVSGTLWLEYPALGGQSAALTITLDGRTNWFRHHSSRVRGHGPAWVTASGVEGLNTLTVRALLGGDEKDSKPPQEAVRYTVRLYFMEPGEAAPGERVFTVSLQGRDVLKDCDIAALAGGAWRGVMREFTGVPVVETLSLAFRRTKGSPLPPLLCGLEMVAEPGPDQPSF